MKLNLRQNNTLVGVIEWNLDPDSGSYIWTVGDTVNGTAEPGTGYNIRVRLIGTGTVDESDLPFTLTN